MAMGAHASDIAGMVVGHGLKLTAVGVGLGLAGALPRHGCWPDCSTG